MSKLLNDLLNFLSSATPEQLKENWKHLEPYENIGPNAREFAEYCNNIYQYSYCNNISKSVIYNKQTDILKMKIKSK